MAAERNIHHLLNADRIQQAGKLRFAAVHRRDCGIHLTLISDIFFRCHRFGRNSQAAAENEAMQENYIQPELRLRYVR